MKSPFQRTEGKESITNVANNSTGRRRDSKNLQGEEGPKSQASVPGGVEDPQHGGE